MEKVNLGYSTKNIPVPNNDAYLQMLIGKMGKFAHNLRWMVFFFLRPEARPTLKETYEFKSIAPAPGDPLLKSFEDGFSTLVKNVKFGRKSNHFLQKLKQDERKIKSEDRPLIKGDKSTNYYKMDAKNYDQLL